MYKLISKCVSNGGTEGVLIDTLILGNFSEAKSSELSSYSKQLKSRDLAENGKF